MDPVISDDDAVSPAQLRPLRLSEKDTDGQGPISMVRNESRGQDLSRMSSEGGTHFSTKVSNAHKNVPSRKEWRNVPPTILKISILAQI